MTNVIMISSTCLVLYAPYFGAAGLDNDHVKNRLEVYREEYHQDDDFSTIIRDMDETIPFYPEIVFYRVFSKRVGKADLGWGVE